MCAVRYKAMLFNITPSRESDTTTLTIGFGDPSTNDQIVQEVKETLRGLELGGKLCLITGPASLPVGAVIIHHVSHLFGAVGVFDPKLQKFVISVSHDPDHKIGELI